MLNVGGTEVPLTLGIGQETLKLHVFLDRSVMEVFINDGQAAVTRVDYSLEEDLAVGVFAENGMVNLNSLDVWQMASIWTGLPFCNPPLLADTNDDCVVDMADLAQMAADWLVCTHISGSCF